MGLFDSADEKKRKESLEALENKRLAFVSEMKALGIKSEAALYGQTGGGFHGVIKSGDQIVYVTGPGPQEENAFAYAVHPGASVRVEEIVIPSDGLGGILGFGKKGGAGYRLALTFPDGTTGDIEIVAGQNCYFEQNNGVDPLFDEKRRRANANFVWDFKPVDKSLLNPILDRWLPRIQG